MVWLAWYRLRMTCQPARRPVRVAFALGIFRLSRYQFVSWPESVRFRFVDAEYIEAANPVVFRTVVVAELILLDGTANTRWQPAL